MIPQKGKIISVPIDKVDGGIITYYNDGKILEGDPRKTIPSLKTLVVEFADCDGCMKMVYNGENTVCCGDKIKRVPLLLSQWQEALDKGWIDSDREISFILDIPIGNKIFVAKVTFTKTWDNIREEASRERSKVRPVTAHLDREEAFWNYIITNYNVQTEKKKNKN